MQWFYGLKLGAKLMTGFVLVALITAVVGVVGIQKIHRIEAEDRMLYEKATVPISDLSEISTDVQKIGVAIRDAVIVTSAGERQTIVQSIAKYKEGIDKNIQDIEKTLLTEEARKAFANFKKDKDDYFLLVDKFVQLAVANKTREAADFLTGDVRKVGNSLSADVNNLVESKVKTAKETADGNALTATSASRFMFIMIVLGAGLALGLGVFISRIVKGQLGADPSEVGAIANRIAAGDMSLHIDLANIKADSVMASVKKMADAITALVTDAAMLSEAAVAGRLVTRADATRHQGEFRTVITGVNATLDAVVGPLKVAAEYVERIGKGDIPPQHHRAVQW